MCCDAAAGWGVGVLQWAGAIRRVFDLCVLDALALLHAGTVGGVFSCHTAV